MARLLASQCPIAALQGRPHVAVANRGGNHVDALLGHGPVKAQVGHYCDNYGVARQPALLEAVCGADCDDLVAVD